MSHFYKIGDKVRILPINEARVLMSLTLTKQVTLLKSLTMTSLVILSVMKMIFSKVLNT